GEESGDMLAEYYRSRAEPDDMARYWLLANLYWLETWHSTKIALEAEKDDSSDLVRMLARGILAPDSPAHLQRLNAGLRDRENSRVLWTALRALQVVVLPSLVDDVIDVMLTTKEAAFIYDGLLVLYNQLRDPGFNRTHLQNALTGEVAAN